MKKFLAAVLFLGVFTMAAPHPGMAADAAGYPDKPIKLVVPFAPGGSSDVAGRILAKYLGEKLGVEVPVLNVTGAAGFAGTQQVADSRPDGYTFLQHIPTFMTSYHTGVSRLNWDDMAPIARGQQFYEVLAVRNDAPWNTVEELIADAKANPGKIKWGLNLGAGLHFMALDFADATDTVDKWQYVNSGGDETSLKELLGGHIDVMGSGELVVDQHVKNGTLKLLGSFADKRTPLLPDVPTFNEMGIPSEFIFDVTYYMPKETDPAIVDKMRQAMEDVTADPKYVEELQAQGLVPAYLAGQELRDMLLDQDVRFYKFAKLGGLIPPRH